MSFTSIEEALNAHRWLDALVLIDDAEEAGPTAALVEQRALAMYGSGNFEGTVAAWEEQHRLLLADGDPGGAARAAAMVAMFLMIDTGLMAPVRGWLRRAETLLSTAPDDSIRATVSAVRTYERFMCGDLDAARQEAGRAIDLGRTSGNAAASVIGRTATARIAILYGQVAEGIAELDEVGVLLMGGAVDPLTTGMMLCELVCAAQGLSLHEMAVEWTRAMESWSSTGAAFGGLHGRCRVHRAEILRVTGPADAAEAEALGACDDLRPWMRREFGWPLAELGTIRLRMGDLEGAEEAFAAAHEHVWCPHPGMALVHLARGDVTTAMALIGDAVAHPFQAPSKERPPFGDLTLAPLLEAQVEIATAMNDEQTARTAASRLQEVADTYGTPWLCASAALAWARVALLEGDLDRAANAAGSAVGDWAEIGAPYETAVARTVLAEAYERAGRDTAAHMERDAAIHGFERYGAMTRAAVVRTPTHDRVGPNPSSDAPRHATFEITGDVRTVTFAGESASLRDLKGYRYLARMFSDPGREFHVLDLVAVEEGTLTAGTATVGGGEALHEGSHAGLPTLDEHARSAYRRRLEEIDEDIADARRCNDDARAELAERDRDFLLAELSRSLGLSGRFRSVGSDVERARTAVTRALRYSIERLRDEVPDLGAHLDGSLRTGTYCSYRPDPTAPIVWSV